MRLPIDNKIKTAGISSLINKNYDVQTGRIRPPNLKIYPYKSFHFLISWRLV